MSYAETAPTETKPQDMRTVIIPKNKQTINTYDIEELANRAANSTIDGFLAQDKHDFEASCLQFTIMLQTMFPGYESERLLKASQAYVSALFVQSKVKDDFPDSNDRMHDDRWEYVRSELERMCRILEIPLSFGIETEEFWRYFAGRDDQSFVKHIIELHRPLIRKLTGKESYFSVFAGLYYAGVALHNERTPYSVAVAREIMRMYFRLLFQVMAGEDRA